MMLVAPIALLLASTQAPAADLQDLQDVTTSDHPAHAHALVPRIHRIPEQLGDRRRERLEAVLADPSSTRDELSAAYDEYVELLDSGSGVRRAQDLADTILAFLELDLGKDLGGGGRFIDRISFGGSGERHRGELDLEVRPTADGTGLLVRASEGEHARISSFLEQLTEEDRQILFEATIYTATRSEASALTDGRSVRVLTEAQRDEVLSQLSGLDSLAAPSVLVRPGMRASLSAGEEIAYVQDYRIQTLIDEDTQVADPVIGTIFDGLSMEVLAGPVGDALRMYVSFESSRVERPIKAMSLSVGGSGATLTVQRPLETSVETTVAFEAKADANVLLLATDPKGATDEAALVMLRARFVEPEPSGAQDREGR